MVTLLRLSTSRFSPKSTCIIYFQTFALASREDNQFSLNVSFSRPIHSSAEQPDCIACNKLVLLVIMIMVFFSGNNDLSSSSIFKLAECYLSQAGLQPVIYSKPVRE